MKKVKWLSLTNGLTDVEWDFHLYYKQENTWLIAFFFNVVSTNSQANEIWHENLLCYESKTWVTIKKPSWSKLNWSLLKEVKPHIWSGTLLFQLLYVHLLDNRAKTPLTKHPDESHLTIIHQSKIFLRQMPHWQNAAPDNKPPKKLAPSNKLALHGLLHVVREAFLGTAQTSNQGRTARS